MRIKVAIVMLLLFGGILTANLLTENKTLSPGQMAKVTTACSGCHGGIPAYDAAIKVHNKHAAFDCSRCHSDSSSLKSTDTFHISLRWIGVGAISLALMGIITNAFLVNRKDKVT